MVIADHTGKINIDMKQMDHTMKKKILVMNVVGDEMIEKEETIMGDTVMIDTTNQRILNVNQEMTEVNIKK